MKPQFPLFVVLMLILISFSLGIRAQTVSVETQFNAGVEPKAIDLPVPGYPEGAENKGRHGTIKVPVTIDQEGSVQVSSDSAIGPYPTCPQVTDTGIVALRNAAIKAAQKAKFAPTLVNGRPAAIVGEIIYTFSLPEKASVEKPESDKADPIVGTKNNESVASAKDEPLNGIALSLPKPPYPAEAKASKAHGNVDVNIVIDEKGSVFSAEAMSGNPLLRSSAEIAACKARFEPTILRGQAISVSAVITYNFVR